MPSVYGTTKVNKTRYQNTINTPISATSGKDDITLQGAAYQIQYRLQTVLGLDGDDSFHGTGGRLFGGAGNDTFWNTGVSHFDDPEDPQAIAHGGAGNDRFIDYYGSTAYFGGSGADSFTNLFYGTHVNPAETLAELDVDTVSLGGGRDRAEAWFAPITFGHGFVWEPRIMDLDGGAGIDTLVLLRIDGLLTMQPGAHLDLRKLDKGSMLFADGTIRAQDFERFELRYGDVHLKKITFGKHDDKFQWYGFTGKQQQIEYRLGGGDDLIVTADGQTGNTVFGGAGHDLLFAHGGDSRTARDKLFGGPGDDVLFSGTRAVTHINLAMRGGDGADTFVLQEGYSQKIKLLDFDPAQDRLVINELTTFYYQDTDSMMFYDPATVRAQLEKAIATPDLPRTVDKDDFKVTLTGSKLQIEIPTAPYDSAEFHYQLRYDRDTGVIRHRDTPGEAFEVLARINGAPDLSAADFIIT